MPVTTQEAVALLSDMVRIESVTPWLIPTGSGEGALAQFIAGRLAGTGAEVEIVEVEPGRPNVLARLRGTGGGPTLCVNAHTDTVGFASWPEEALVPRLDGDRLYGLGVADDKSGVAAGLLAIESLARSGTRLRGDLLLAAVADEEGVSIGSEHLAAQHRSGQHEIDAAIVIEPQPTEHLVVEHQGFGWIDVIAHGVAAHGCVPEIGVDAIVHLAEVITRLHRLDLAEYVPTAPRMSGRTVFHTGTISGGTDYATYPSRAVLGIEIGTQPGEHLSDRVAEIEAIFADIARDEPTFRGEVVVRLDRDPFQAAGHERLQETVAAAMRGVLGHPPTVTGMNGWTDAALMQEAGIPTVLIGATGGNFHAADEWVSVGEFVKLCAIVEQAAVSFLG
jgi:acetylornithine deacetylase/succinyl-diaminopimelate desuccinylase-like protein